MGVDPRYPRDDMDRIAAELRDMRRRLDELERPSGWQLGGAQRVGAVEAAIDERWINDEIEARIQAAVNAALAAAFSGNVSITGALSVNGPVVAASYGTAGDLTVGGVVKLPGAAAATPPGTKTPAVFGDEGRIGKA